MEPVPLLLIDPDARWRDDAARMLTPRGFCVTQGQRLTDGARLAHKSSARVVITDVDADAGTGLPALKKLRDEAPELPVVLLCGEDVGHLEEARVVRGVELLFKPADIDYLCVLLRRLSARTGHEHAAETTIAELMVPVSSYRRVYEDEPLRDVIRTMTMAVFHSPRGKITEQGHRSVLVYSRDESFLGCLRLNDVLEMFRPPAREDAPEPFRRGMFAARAKMLAGVAAGDLLGEQRFVDEAAPLMEAAQIMFTDGLINVPVLREGELVGMLTDKSLLLSMNDDGAAQ